MSVPGHMDLIEVADVADLCRGSVFLATGGGGDPYVNQLLTEQALREFGPVRLAPVASLADDDRVVPMGEVGAPTVSLEQLPVGDEPMRALARFEAFTGRATTHLIPFEIGGANSVIPLIAAAARGLPVVDGDGMGRALPEAQMMTFAIEGVSPTPAVAVDYLGNTILLETRGAEDYERQIRALAVAMGGMIFTCEHAMSGIQARRAVVPGTLSFAVRIGRLLRERRGNAEALLAPLAELFAATDYGVVWHLFTGKVTAMSVRTVGGFDVGEARIEALTGAGSMTIAIKNEYLLAERDGRVVASVPDLIMVVDAESGQPINSERLRYGQRVTVIGVGCPPHYRSAAALRVVAPRCFGFDIDYQPLETLAGE
ncbi:MAG TPA: DUF917 domain-containing protein [Pseudomonadales bacterium]|nr:DUF917 domain-containing protein [Pseudomonadales bacterium]